MLDRIYRHRFTEADAERRNGVWREVARHLQRYVGERAVVLDLACDRGYFIRHIAASEKWALDARDVSAFLPPAVRFVQGDGLALPASVPRDYFDVVFISNYLEHLETGEQVVEQLSAVRQVLRSGGRVIVLQPNVRLVGPAYWHFLDHKVALTERSLVEAAELAGFTTATLIVRFLPYTTKSRLPQHPRLVQAYLAFRPAWRILGKQTLYVGTKGAAGWQ